MDNEYKRQILNYIHKHSGLSGGQLWEIESTLGDCPERRALRVLALELKLGTKAIELLGIYGFDSSGKPSFLKASVVKDKTDWPQDNSSVFAEGCSGTYGICADDEELYARPKND